MTDWPLKRSEDALPRDDSLGTDRFLSFLGRETQVEVAEYVAGTAVKLLRVNTEDCCCLVCDCVEHLDCINSAALPFSP